MGKTKELRQMTIFGAAISFKDKNSIEYLSKLEIDQQKKLNNALSKIEKMKEIVQKTRQSIESIKSKYSQETSI